MPCYRPIGAYRAPSGGVSFSPRSGYIDRPLNLPCGQCIGCRLERSRQWAVRCMHEASMHDANCWLTLTYRDAPASLDRRAVPTFMRRLRKKQDAGEIKYFHCGEYGEVLARPHYHVLIFGFDFTDKTRWSTSPAGHAQYRSPTLEVLWPAGHALIGPVTFETAAYTARYCTKKITGDLAEAHYGGREPEFMTCSKGIGRKWFEKFHGETYRDDSVVVRGHEQKPPRYYDKLHADLVPLLHRRVELRRLVSAAAPSQVWNRTPERLAVREVVKTAEVAVNKQRSYE